LSRLNSILWKFGRVDPAQLDFFVTIYPDEPPQSAFGKRRGTCLLWTAAEDSVPRDWTGKKKKKSDVSMSLSVPFGKGDRVRTVYRTSRLGFSMFIVCMCTYVWWCYFWDGSEFDLDFFVFLFRCLLRLMLFVCPGGYLEASGPLGEPGPAELPLLRLSRARRPAMQDFCWLWSGPFRVAGG